MAKASLRVTLQSIADELGISRTTVSNAYNRPEHLSVELLALVFKTAEKYGYNGPDPLARKLRTRQTSSVGMVFTESLSYAIRDPAAAGFLEGVARACEDAGTSLLLIPVIPDREIGLSAVEQAAVDGMIVYSIPDQMPLMRMISRKNVPVVVVDDPAPFGTADWVGLDEESSFGLIANHLAVLGHRNVVILCHRLTGEVNNGPASDERIASATYSVQRRRITGFKESFTRRTNGSGTVVVEERYLSEVPVGVDAADDLLARYPSATAIACTSDALALGVLIGLRRQGISVPADFSVTGFDDIASSARVGLTTIRQPLVDKGRTAGELLFSREKDMEPRIRVLAVTLELRTSTGPPRG